MSSADLERTILDKIKFQWKTIRKAFYDLNKKKDGAISTDELKFYLNHWGLNVNEDQFKVIFNKFDYDGDGKISYDDFHKTIGSEIHPGEILYFR
jgi:Ca2+-binding EF-hand superfamily protein